MRLAPVLCAALLLSGVAPALADEQLVRKAGEWEVTRKPPPGQSGASEVRKTCYPVDQTLADAVSKGMQDCTKKDVHTVGGKMTIDALCKLDDAPVSLHAIISRTGENQFHTEGRMHFDNPPANTPADATIVTDAKWLGPCPAGSPQQ
jgi:hypothetical protein